MCEQISVISPPGLTENHLGDFEHPNRKIIGISKKDKHTNKTKTTGLHTEPSTLKTSLPSQICNFFKNPAAAQARHVLNTVQQGERQTWLEQRLEGELRSTRHYSWSRVSSAAAPGAGAPGSLLLTSTEPAPSAEQGTTSTISTWKKRYYTSFQQCVLFFCISNHLYEVPHGYF